eukprot:scaffold263_cov120-Isochrysis_galbana.AAC.3
MVGSSGNWATSSAVSPSCVSWIRRWPRTGLANRPPMCLPDPPPPGPLPGASNAHRPAGGL